MTVPAGGVRVGVKTVRTRYIGYGEAAVTHDWRVACNAIVSKCNKMRARGISSIPIDEFKQMLEDIREARYVEMEAARHARAAELTAPPEQPRPEHAKRKRRDVRTKAAAVVPA